MKPACRRLKGWQNVKRTIEKRLKELENSLGGCSPELYAAIERGVYYDELPPDLRQEYLKYQDADEQILFFIPAQLLAGLAEFKHEPVPERAKNPLHRRLEFLPPPAPWSPEEIVQGFVEAYNSPQEKAKREAEYQELQRIGALRKAAFERGEPMDKYPLPWEKERLTEKN